MLIPIEGSTGFGYPQWQLGGCQYQLSIQTGIIRREEEKGRGEFLNLFGLGRVVIITVNGLPSIRNWDRLERRAITSGGRELLRCRRLSAKFRLKSRFLWEESNPAPILINSGARLQLIDL